MILDLHAHTDKSEDSRAPLETYLKWLQRTQGAKRFKAKAIPPVAAETLSKWRQVDKASIHEVNRDEVNRILDKISASGIASLTPQEKLFLSNFVPPDDRLSPS